MFMKCGSSECCTGVMHLGLALGATCGLFVMLFGWAGIFGYGTDMIAQYALIYHGYAPTFLGGIIGGLWGFVHGFIFGAVLAYFYNMCGKYCKGKEEK